MSFDKLIDSLDGKDHLPDGVTVPAASIHIESAEGYVEPIDGLMGDPHADEDDEQDLEGEEPMSSPRP